MSPPASGWLILDKPRGMGSTQAVGAVKRVLRQGGHAKTKVGHGGTLDPLAEGVLPIALGEATKLAGRMLDSDKIYEFTVAFGEETATLDTEGAVTARSDHRPPLAAIAAICDHFTGAIEQVPPKYSALMVDGKRAYDRARAGEDVELATRPVTIYSLSPARGYGRSEVDSAFATTAGRPNPYDPQAPLELADSVTLIAHVSKGTYIRSLARDLAGMLGAEGHVTALRREQVGPFSTENAVTLDILREMVHRGAASEGLLPVATALDDIPDLAVTATDAFSLRQGRPILLLPRQIETLKARLMPGS